MNIKKVYTYLINLNYEEGFLRLAKLATPFWVIGFIIYIGINISFLDIAPIEFLFLGIFFIIVNPISFYFVMMFVLIHPVVWFLKGFSNAIVWVLKGFNNND